MQKHRPKKPLDEARDAIQLKHYPFDTERAYVGSIKSAFVGGTESPRLNDAS
jgi:hypothetical protein